VTLTGKIAVVLGASASGGTGWAVAEGLAAEGAKVVVGARRLEPLQELAEKIGGLAVRCDAGSPEDIAHILQAAVDHFGGLDVAVNSAAETSMNVIADTDEGAFQRTLDVNYIGNVHFIREATKRMANGGAITLVSSAVSQQPVPNRFAYACSKAAMDCLVRHAALEYGPRGVRVNSVLPGPIKSELASRMLATPGVEEAFLRQIPIGWIATPKDIADVIVWLSKPNYLTGVNLPTSGGMHLTQPPRVDKMGG